ncbi:hypothetical protein HDF18_05140 [Mucilaginibacter sp. X5P1]|uniref:hypothetical protein n=1 Tax=Mucilaginibacter sp. X5P1 TaxID=2723088 RepID=UPI003B00F625
MMNNYRPYVQQGRLVGLLYFSWNSDPLSKNVSFGSIFRCGALTESGKSALDPGLLK